MQACTRGLLLGAASILVLWTITGCEDSAESQRNYLEKSGYSNVQIVDGVRRPYTLSATLNGCSLELFIAQDTDQWNADVIKTPKGDPPPYSIFAPADDASLLKANKQFTAICP